MPHGRPPAKRSNAAMDVNGRAMDIVFPSIIGMSFKVTIQENRFASFFDQ